MSNRDTAEILKSYGLRKTDIRQSVLRMFLETEKALSQQDIDEKMPDADRVTLYRTLRTFEEKGLVHHAVDSTNTTKYALCHADCDAHNHKDEHAHFHCRECGITYCVDDMHLPAIPARINGAYVEHVHLVVEGLCEKCSK